MYTGKRLYRTSSGMEPGTLYLLRNLRNVKPNPKMDVNSSIDFVEVIRLVMSFLR